MFSQDILCIFMVLSAVRFATFDALNFEATLYVCANFISLTTELIRIQNSHQTTKLYSNGGVDRMFQIRSFYAMIAARTRFQLLLSS